MGKLRLFGTIHLTEEKSRETIFKLKDVRVDILFSKTIEFINRKYHQNFVNNIKHILKTIKDNIKNVK